MTWRALTVEQFNSLNNKVIVDVRSPCEFAKEYIPGAYSVPLLSDNERSEVGIIYKEKGEAIARRHAVGIISPKIPDLVDAIIELKKPGHALVVHCWRGGLRSEAVVSFLSVVGVDSFRLTGGYKAWRRSVVDDFEKDAYGFEVVVLQGLTGSGKTDILKQLEKRGEAVLDLEDLANHRGSVFGGIGLADQPSQKNFEGFVWQCLKTHGPCKRLFIEAESRKIGQLAVPSFLLERMKKGRRILVEGTVEGRCKRLVTEYSAKLDKERVQGSLNALKPLREKLGGQRLKTLSDLLEADRFAEFTEVLLLEYYDPLYIRHLRASQPYELIVNGDDPSEAAERIVRYFSKPLAHAEEESASPININRGT